MSGGRAGSSVGPHVLGAVEQIERLCVVALGPHAPVQVRGRLDVVVEDVGRRLEHRPQRLLAEAEEVGHEHLDAAAGIRAARSPGWWPRSGPRRGRAGRRGRPTSRRRGAGPSARRPRATRSGSSGSSGRSGRPRRDGAVAAGARAHVAHDLERGGAAAPALADVRAAGLLADGVQAALAHEPAQLAEARRSATVRARSSSRGRVLLQLRPGHGSPSGRRSSSRSNASASAAQERPAHVGGRDGRGRSRRRSR